MSATRERDDGRDLNVNDEHELELGQNDRELRCLMDKVLREDIRAAGAGSAAARQLGGTLHECGMGFLLGMYANNDLTWKHKETTFTLYKTVLPATAEERYAFFNDVVVATIESFMTACVFGDQWDPRRGATLKTFFLGRLKWRLWSQYKQLRDHPRWLETPVADMALIPAQRFSTAADGAVEDVATRIVDRDLVERMMSSVDASPRDKMIYVRYHAQSVPRAEIAKEIGVSPVTVSRALARMQQKFDELVRAHQGLR